MEGTGRWGRSAVGARNNKVTSERRCAAYAIARGQTQRHLRRLPRRVLMRILRARSLLHLVPGRPLTFEINSLKPRINNAASSNIPPLLHSRATHPQRERAAHLQDLKKP